MKYLFNFILIFIMVLGCSTSKNSIELKSSDMGGVKTNNQKNDNIVKKIFNIKNFKKIDVSSTISINLKNGNTFNVQANIDKRYADNLNLDLKDGTLFIYLDNRKNYRNPYIHLDITMPELKNIVSSGASLVEFDDLVANDLKVDISGASKLKGKLKGEDFYLNASGASDVYLEGRLYSTQMNISGNSDVKLNMSVRKAELNLSGVSEIKMKVDDRLRANVSGMSELNLIGNPRRRDIDSNGLSDINILKKW